MSTVTLTGRLVCADEAETAVVRRCLPRHVELTFAEEGCLRFEVEATDDPLVWEVREEFADQAAFDSHQARVRTSEWGRATSAITRDYVVEHVGR
ncbi:MAG: putative quinol monooxygenase [Actinomycetaceae bacterium]